MNTHLSISVEKGSEYPLETCSLQSANGIANGLSKAILMTWKTCCQIAPSQGEEEREESKKMVTQTGPQKLQRHLSLAKGRQGHPGGTGGKESTCQCRRHKSCGCNPCVGKIPCKRDCQPTPVFLPAESYGRRSLVGMVHRVSKSQTQLKQLSMHAEGDRIKRITF